MWIVECKDWQTRIPKEKVLVLRQIVDDVGADRGFLMNEVGFQKGALEAALLSNVELTSLAALGETCAYDLATEQLRRIYDRIRECRERYWEIPKSVRIEQGLRGEYDPLAYSGDRVTKTVEACAIWAILIGYPVVYDEVMVPLSVMASAPIEPGDHSIVFHRPDELVEHLSTKVVELEDLLTRAEGAGCSD